MPGEVRRAGLSLSRQQVLPLPGLCVHDHTEKTVLVKLGYPDACDSANTCFGSGGLSMDGGSLISVSYGDHGDGGGGGGAEGGGGERGGGSGGAHGGRGGGEGGGEGGGGEGGGFDGGGGALGFPHIQERLPTNPGEGEGEGEGDGNGEGGVNVLSVPVVACSSLEQTCR